MAVLAVTWSLLWQVVWVSLVAGVTVSALFSLVILASARASDARRGGRERAAAGFAVLAGIVFVVFAGGVAIGVQVMLSK